MENQYSLLFSQGTVVDSKYLIKDYIAEGGVGFVYRAQQRGSSGYQRDVVIKFFKPETSDEPWLEESLDEQIAISGILRHKGVCRALDSGEHQGLKYLVLECINGPDLSSLVGARKVRISEPLALGWALEVSKALTYLHSHSSVNQYPNGLIHGDISLQNIILEESTGRIVLTDFGVLSTYNRAIKQEPPFIFGNTWYMAPEQASCEDLSPASDIYSMGVVLYELLCDPRQELKPLADSEVLGLAIEGQTVNRKRLDKLHPDLSRILRKALSVQANLRYQSSADFSNEIQRYVSRTYGFLDSENLSLQALSEFFATRGEEVKRAQNSSEHRTNRTTLHVVQPKTHLKNKTQSSRTKTVVLGEGYAPYQDPADKDTKAEGKTLKARSKSLQLKARNLGKEISLDHIQVPNDSRTVSHVKKERSVYRYTLVAALFLCTIAVGFWGYHRYVKAPPADSGFMIPVDANARGEDIKERDINDDSTSPESSSAPEAVPTNPDAAELFENTDPYLENQDDPAEPAPEPEALPGFIKVDAIPYALVTIVGTPHSQEWTPLPQVELKPGQWKIIATYTNQATDKKCEIIRVVDIQPEKLVTLRLNMKECRQ